MTLSNKTKRIGAGAAALVLFGIAFLFMSNKDEVASPERVRNEVHLAQTESVPVRVSGVLTSADALIVYAETSGNVVHIAREGDTVATQSLIAHLDTPVTQAQLALSTAQSELTSSQQRLAVEQAQTSLYAQSAESESATNVKNLRSESVYAEVSDTFTQLLTSIELSVLTSIEVLDYIDTNRRLFSSSGIEEYSVAVEKLYGGKPNYLNTGLLTSHTGQESKLLNRLETLQNTEEKNVSEATSLAEEVHLLLTSVHSILRTGEEDALDERVTASGDDVYEEYIAQRNAVVSTKASLESYMSALQSVYDASLQDIVTQEKNAKVASTQAALAESSAELQVNIERQAQSVAYSNNRVLQAQLSLAYTHAPFTGVVSKVFVEDGEYVTPGTPLMELRGTGVYEVKVSVPARFAGFVMKGQAFVVNNETIGYVDRFAPVLHEGALEVFLTIGGESFTSGEVLAGTLELVKDGGDIYSIERNYVHFGATGPYLRFVDESTTAVEIIYDRGGVLYILPDEVKEIALLSAAGGTL